MPGTIQMFFGHAILPMSVSIAAVTFGLDLLARAEARLE